MSAEDDPCPNPFPPHSWGIAPEICPRCAEVHRPLREAVRRMADDLVRERMAEIERRLEGEP